LKYSHLKEFNFFARDSESHRFQNFGKSISSSSNSLFSNLLTFGHVLSIEKINSFSKSLIDESGSNFKGFLSPDSWVHAWIDFALWVFFHDSSSDYSLVYPVIICDWNFFGNVEFVDNFIPNSMKFFSFIVCLSFERVSSSITSWVFIVNSTDAMKWLMDIS